MTKIRTTEQLYDHTTEELAWRRKELQLLRALLSDVNIGESKRNVLLRSLVSLTYAHWEGFVRNCATAYLEFVAMQRLRHKELATNFIALSAKSLINAAKQSNKAVDHIELTQFFLCQMDDRSSIPYKDGIDTRSNLSSSVFRNIICTLGLDYAQYATKEKLLDEKLLKLRNHVAHGEYIPVDKEEILEMHLQCVQLMVVFQNQINNAAVLDHFRNSEVSST